MRETFADVKMYGYVIVNLAKMQRRGNPETWPE